MNKVIIATTPKPWNGLIDLLQRNAVASWLRQDIPDNWEREIIIYGDDPGTAEACSEYGVTYEPDIVKTSSGTPDIGAIFSDLQSHDADLYCYVNADIIVSNDNLIVSVVQQYNLTPRYIGTAARCGLIVTEEIKHWEYLYPALAEQVKQEKPRCGVDIFIFTKDTLPKMPSFALGRGFWDKWFIVTGSELSKSPKNVPFVNFTNAFWTVHQSHDYSHLDIKKKNAWDTRGFIWENGEGKGPETRVNHKLFTTDYPKNNIKQPYVDNCTLQFPGNAGTPEPGNTGTRERRARVPACPKDKIISRTYKMLQRRRAGTGHHRTGWPWICDVLGLQADGEIVLDDFVCQTFEWGDQSIVHTTPWVGIFHHPVVINGPVGTERTILGFPRQREWRASLPQLRGAVVMCEESAEYLRSELGIPTLKILYPKSHLTVPWSIERLRNRRPLTILQVGESHRNIRYIYSIKTPQYWCKKRLVRNSSVMRKIDSVLATLYPDTMSDTLVETLPRLSDKTYDELLASSVIIQQVYGAAANNVVVECMTRGTPIITNKLAPIMEYLGEDYPLYVDNFIPEHYWHASTLIAANKYLLERAKILPTLEEFTTQVNDFCSTLR